MTSSMRSPELSAYRRQLRAELSLLPRGRARELKEQIESHLDEALPEEASKADVLGVLAELGPARSVVAEAAASEWVPLGRRVLVRLRRVRWWWSLLVAMVVLGGGTLLGLTVSWETAAPVGFYSGSFGWWGPVHHEVNSSANGEAQSTISIEPGHLQGYVLQILNPSPWPQTVLGRASAVVPGIHGGPIYGPGLAPIRIAVSTTCGVDCEKFPSLTYRSTVTIPAHQMRVLRVLWVSSRRCDARRTSTDQTTITLRVRVGWVTRTEVVQLPQGFALAGTSPNGCH